MFVPFSSCITFLLPFCALTVDTVSWVSRMVAVLYEFHSVISKSLLLWDSAYPEVFGTIIHSVERCICPITTRCFMLCYFLWWQWHHSILPTVASIYSSDRQAPKKVNFKTVGIHTTFLAVSKLSRNVLKHAKRNMLLHILLKLLNLRLWKHVGNPALYSYAVILFYFTANKHGVITLFTYASIAAAEKRPLSYQHQNLCTGL